MDDSQSKSPIDITNQRRLLQIGLSRQIDLSIIEQTRRAIDKSIATLARTRPRHP